VWSAPRGGGHDRPHPALRAWPAAVPALATAASVPAGLGLTAFTLGLRHGLDWDHLAAIADLGVAQRSRRRAIGVASLYIAGHAAVVLLFGGLGLFFATRLPADVE